MCAFLIEFQGRQKMLLTIPDCKFFWVDFFFHCYKIRCPCVKTWKGAKFFLMSIYRNRTSWEGCHCPQEWHRFSNSLSTLVCSAKLSFFQPHHFTAVLAIYHYLRMGRIYLNLCKSQAYTPKDSFLLQKPINALDLKGRE